MTLEPVVVKADTASKYASENFVKTPVTIKGNEANMGRMNQISTRKDIISDLEGFSRSSWKAKYIPIPIKMVNIEQMKNGSIRWFSLKFSAIKIGTNSLIPSNMRIYPMM